MSSHILIQPRWLSHWSVQSDAAQKVYFYLFVYAALGGASTLLVLIRSFIFAVGGLNAALSLHEQLVQRVRHMLHPCVCCSSMLSPMRPGVTRAYGIF